MSEYIISCCSPADLKKEHFNKRDIKYIWFHYYLDGEHFYDDLGESKSYKEFYQAMVDGADTKTSQVNATEFEAYFEGFLKEGKDILHVTISSGISGTYNSANIAKDILEEKYPDRKIYIVDSLCAASGHGLLMDKLADLRDEGKSIEEVRDWAVENRLKMHHLVATTDLTFLIRGGRLSKTAGFVGKVLNICPILIINQEGKLVAKEKVRTKKKAYKRLIELIGELTENGNDYNDKCYVSHSDRLEEAKAVAAMINEAFPKLNEPVLINDIGTTIGSHTGPGTVAVFFWGKEKEVEENE